MLNWTTAHAKNLFLWVGHNYFICEQTHKYLNDKQTYSNGLYYN